MKFSEDELKAELLYKDLTELLCNDAIELAPSFNDFKNIVLENDLSLTKVVPNETKGISLTGKECEQDCAHCNGHYLNGMGTLKDSLENFKSLLISGGGDKTGAVSIKKHLSKLESLNKRLNLHPGFQSPDNIKSLASKSTVSFDLPSCENVIKNIYKLNHKVKDYRQLYLEYLKVFDTVAHLTIGLGTNTLAGELDTMDFLSKYPPRELVLIVFRPTKGTEMAEFPAPSLGDAVNVLTYGLEKAVFPISLGCMRPSGRYRKNLDILFWLRGVRKIVLPNVKLVKVLQKHGVVIEEFNECCGLEGCGENVEEL